MPEIIGHNILKNLRLCISRATMKLSNKVKRWLDSLSSSNTHRNYKLALLKFCEGYNVTPDQSLKWSVEEIEDKVKDHINGLRKSGLAGSTLRLRLTGLKMWFRFNRIHIHPDVRNIPNGRTRLSYIPTRDDVRQVLNAVGLKHKVMISLIAFAGLRPVDIASLQYKHIRASIDRNDEVLTIEKKHEKVNEWYVSFLGHQGTKYVRDYLKTRGDLKDEDYLIVNSRKQPFKSKGIRTALETAIKKSVGKNPDGPIKTFRPYSLRKYFRRTLSKIGNETAEYLMGHRSGLTSMSAIYTGLQDLDTIAVGTLKEQYISILPELETELSEISVNGKLQEQKEGLLEAQDQSLKYVEQRLADLQREQDELKEYIAVGQSRDSSFRLDKAQSMMEGIENTPKGIRRFAEEEPEKLARITELVLNTAKHNLIQFLQVGPEEEVQEIIRQLREESQKEGIPNWPNRDLREEYRKENIEAPKRKTTKKVKKKKK